MSDEEPQVYCICRSSNVNRFMIGCEHCDEWYHGDCVNVTEKDAKYIKRYYCKECREKNPNLHVVYKSKFKEIIREREKERDKHHSKKSSHSGDKDKDKSERRRERERREERKRKKKESRDKERQKSEQNDEEVDRKKTKKSVEPSKFSSSQRTSSLDSKPTDSPKQHSLTSKHKNNLIKNEPKSETDNDEEVALSPTEKKVKVSLSDSEDAWEPSKTTVSKTKSKESKNSHKKSSQTHSKTVRSGVKRKRGRRASGSDSDLDPVAFWDFAANLRGSRHCFGHKCTKEAREGSKYCSDNCGVNMASMRIMQTLPDRIREWNLTPCEADKRNRKDLESIRAKQDAVKSSLEQLQREFKSLEDLIAKGKSQTIDERDSDDEEDSSAVEMTVHCVTCGSDVQTRTAIRHMERCYNKMESQTSFASRFKTQIDDERMFCDFYNPKEGTYCKRLQVLCPEHNPDEKKIPRDDEVCGYPIQKELFGKPGEFCRSSKRACQAHYCWEKFRRAELDMERVKQWMKVDELIEQERMVRSSMSNRAGVLGLLLHSTFNHELEERFKKRAARPVAK